MLLLRTVVPHPRRPDGFGRTQHTDATSDRWNLFRRGHCRGFDIDHRAGCPPADTCGRTRKESKVGRGRATRPIQTRSRERALVGVPSRAGCRTTAGAPAGPFYGSIVQDNIQERAVHSPTAVVLDEAQAPEIVHGRAHPRPRGAHQLDEGFLTHLLDNDGFLLAILTNVSKQQKDPSQSPIPADLSFGGQPTELHRNEMSDLVAFLETSGVPGPPDAIDLETRQLPAPGPSAAEG